MFRIPTLLFAFCILNICFTQNWIDTLEHPRNVVLEEFTGIYCGFCPYGHQIAHSIDSANPGRVSIIGIHSSDTYSQPGSAAHPDFRTQWGLNLQSFSGLTGFPSGMVNRTIYGGKKAMSRFDWEAATDSIFELGNSEVNIGMRSLWNESTRTLSIDVELYYHEEQNLFNKLNLAITESNVIGYQGGSQGGASYSHAHVLRDLISAVEANSWSGVKVDDIVTGELQTFNFEYVVDAGWDIENCELVAFVTKFSNSETLHGVHINAANDSTIINSSTSNISELNKAYDIKAFPNPANEFIYFKGTTQMDKIIIYDLLGNLVKSESINDDNYRLDLTDLNNGLYFYEVHFGMENQKGRFIH